MGSLSFRINVTLHRLGRAGLMLICGLLALMKVIEELSSLTQAPHHHLTITHHLSHDSENWLPSEVEASVHPLHRILDLIGRKVRITKGGCLDSAARHQHAIVKPSVLSCLII